MRFLGCFAEQSRNHRILLATASSMKNCAAPPPRRRRCANGPHSPRPCPPPLKRARHQGRREDLRASRLRQRCPGRGREFNRSPAHREQQQHQTCASHATRTSKHREHHAYDNGAQAMGNCKHCALRKDFSDHLLNQRVRFNIHRSRTLIHY